MNNTSPNLLTRGEGKPPASARAVLGLCAERELWREPSLRQARPHDDLPGHDPKGLCLGKRPRTFISHPTESKASQVIKTLNKRHGFCVVILICYLTGSFVLMGILYQTISNYSSCLFLPPNQWYMLPIWNRFSLCPFYLQIILRLYL